MKVFIVFCLLANGATAFTVPRQQSVKVPQIALFSSTSPANQDGTEESMLSRRSFVGASFASALIAMTGSSSAAGAAQEKETRQGIEVTPFNGLTFNYRNSGFNGLDADDLDEPSVPYAEFCDRLKAGEVEFVEFLAPDGDKAYVTFKPKEGETKSPDPIRIGEGYPIEQHDGWSSPAFAVRTVKNAGVPYKFTVPGLAKYSTKS